MPLFQTTFPVVADVTGVLVSLGVSQSIIDALDIQGELDAVESELAELCGGAFLVEPNAGTTTLRHNAPDGVVLTFKAPLVASPDAPLVQVQLAHIDEPLTAILEDVDYTLWPETAPQKGLPYAGLVLHHSIHCARNGLLVTGLVGFGTRISSLRFQAIVGGVVGRLYPAISARLKASGSTQNGAVKAKQIGQLREEYVALDASKVAALQTEVPALAARYDEFVLAICNNKPLTA